MKPQPMIAITLIRSPIGRPSLQKRIVRSLGLRKLRQTVLRRDTPEIQGMVRKVHHLISVGEARGNHETS